MRYPSICLGLSDDRPGDLWHRGCQSLDQARRGDATVLRRLVAAGEHVAVGHAEQATLLPERVRELLRFHPPAVYGYSDGVHPMSVAVSDDAQF